MGAITNWSEMDAKMLVDIAFKLVAALWAFFLLFHLRKRDKAITDIEKSRADTEKARADTEKSRADTEKARADTEKTRAEIAIAQAKAGMELKNSQREIASRELADKELELRIRRQIIVSVEIDVSNTPYEIDRPIVVTVQIKNNGNEATRIRWAGEAPAFTVHYVSFSNNGSPRYELLKEFRVGLTRDPNHPAVSHVIRAGSAETLVFAFQPSQAGLYLLGFRAATDKGVREEAEKHSVLLPTAWTAKRYIDVIKTTPARTASGGKSDPLVPQE